jgi:hypothetical protein
VTQVKSITVITLTGTCYFDYVVISSKAERDQLEVQEINRLRPECNRQ